MRFTVRWTCVCLALTIIQLNIQAEDWPQFERNERTRRPQLVGVRPAARHGIPDEDDQRPVPPDPREMSTLRRAQDVTLALADAVRHLAWVETHATKIHKLKVEVW